MDENELKIEYIPFPVDVLVINGIRYSGDIFRGFASLEIGKVLEIIKRKDGVVHVRNHARPFWKLTSEEEPSPQESVLVSTPTGGYFIAWWNPDWRTWCKAASYDIVELSVEPTECYWQEIIPPRNTKSAP